MKKHKILRIAGSLWLICLAVLAFALPARAQDNPSGLALPRFVSTRSQPVNVRVGPGTRYDVAWVFNLSNLPVEIVQEFDVWRKIRYVDGEEGWVHQNLLSSRRTALVKPFGTGERVALVAQAEEGSKVLAWLGSGLLVDVEQCANAWCKVHIEKTGQSDAMTGYVIQFELWGVYPDETFD